MGGKVGDKFGKVGGESCSGSGGTCWLMGGKAGGKVGGESGSGL